MNTGAWQGMRAHALPVTAVACVSALAFAHIMALPAFEDEGSQLRWIWRIAEAGEWLQPLSDGKPLEAWPMLAALWLGSPPLAAIRQIHVLVGMAGAVLTYLLALRVADRETAFVSGALFAICPFAVYLQRLALSDTLMSTAGLWVLLRTLRFIEHPSRFNAAGLAAALMIAACCKMPVGFIFLMTMPLALALMPASVREDLLRPPLVAKLLGSQLPALLLALAILAAAAVRVHGGHSAGFGLQDLAGIAGGRYEDIAHVMGVAHPNLATELAAQLSSPVLVIGVIGLLAACALGDWRQRWLAAVGAAPMLGIGLLAHFWYPRYLLFTLPPLFIAAASGWRAVAIRCGRFGQALQYGLLAVCAGYMGHQSALIIFRPQSANWSPVDRFQYIESWSSGYGYPEAARFLLGLPGAAPMIFSLDGHGAYQLRTYLPAAWERKVGSIDYGPQGEILRSENARFENLLSFPAVWILACPQLLEDYLDRSFGRANAARLALRPVAVFDKPGSRAQLALYAVARR